MSSDSRTLTLILATVAGLVAALLAWSAKWTYWPTPLTLPVALGIILPKWERSGSHIPNGDALTHEHEVPRHAQRENSVANIALPSTAPDYKFLFSATVRWRPAVNPAVLVPNANPAALAIDAVLSRARAVTQTEDPGAFALAQHRLSSTLGTAVHDPAGQVEAWATNLTLTLSDADLERLRKLEDLHKDEQLWEHQREYERSKRTYLGDDVLKSPGSAIVWWLAKKDDAIERTVELIGPLAQLASAANDREVPELFQHLVPSPTAPDDGPLGFEPSLNGHHQDPRYIADALGRAPSSPVEHVGALVARTNFDRNSPQTMRLVDLVAKFFDAAGEHDTAQQLRRGFDMPISEEMDQAADEESREAPEHADTTMTETNWDT